MKRRDFVIKSGLATTAIAASTSVMGSVFHANKANNTINIAVIGTGDRGTGLTKAINKIKNLNVTACCDVIPFRLQNGLSKVQGKAKGYNDYRKVLEDKNVDAILISTPFSTHSQIALEALDAGKHVYCEKTMAKGYDGISDLVTKVNASDLTFQTGHQYHSSRLYTHVVDLIKSGKIGKVTAFECQWNRNGNWRRSVPSPELEKAINWRMYREYSGGLVAELCSHQIDFVNWVLDATPNKVMGVGGIDYWKDGRETFDNIHLIYEYPNGEKAKFTCLTSNSKDDYLIKVFGDKGTIILDYTKAWIYPEPSQNDKIIGDLDGVSGATIKWDKGLGIPIDVHHIEPSEQALTDFRDSIVNNTKPLSDITTGANTAICVQMGLDAMYSKSIVFKPQ